jgi:hypothetical protein
LALTSPTSGGRSVGIVRSRTKATELVSGETESTLYFGHYLPYCTWMMMSVTQSAGRLQKETEALGEDLPQWRGAAGD